MKRLIKRVDEIKGNLLSVEYGRYDELVLLFDDSYAVFENDCGEFVLGQLADDDKIEFGIMSQDEYDEILRQRAEYERKRVEEHQAKMEIFEREELERLAKKFGVKLPLDKG